MFVPIIMHSEEEIKKSVEEDRQFTEAFEREHPFLSILFALIYGLALLSFCGFWLILTIYLIFFCG